MHVTQTLQEEELGTAASPHTSVSKAGHELRSSIGAFHEQHLGAAPAVPPTARLPRPAIQRRHSLLKVDVLHNGLVLFVVPQRPDLSRG